jgi:hypothetical protein
MLLSSFTSCPSARAPVFGQAARKSETAGLGLATRVSSDETVLSVAAINLLAEADTGKDLVLATGIMPDIVERPAYGLAYEQADMSFLDCNQSENQWTKAPEKLGVISRRKLRKSKVHAYLKQLKNLGPSRFNKDFAGKLSTLADTFIRMDQTAESPFERLLVAMAENATLFYLKSLYIAHDTTEANLDDIIRVFAQTGENKAKILPLIIWSMYEDAITPRNAEEKKHPLHQLCVEAFLDHSVGIDPMNVPHILEWPNYQLKLPPIFSIPESQAFVIRYLESVLADNEQATDARKAWATLKTYMGRDVLRDFADDEAFLNSMNNLMARKPEQIMEALNKKTKPVKKSKLKNRQVKNTRDFGEMEEVLREQTLEAKRRHSQARETVVEVTTHWSTLKGQLTFTLARLEREKEKLDRVKESAIKWAQTAKTGNESDRAVALHEIARYQAQQAEVDRLEEEGKLLELQVKEAEKAVEEAKALHAASMQGVRSLERENAQTPALPYRVRLRKNAWNWRRSSQLPALEGPLDFSLGGFLLQRVALVMKLFALAQADVHFGPGPLYIQLQRDKRQTFFLRFP